MSKLIDQINTAQARTAENLVIGNLEKMEAQTLKENIKNDLISALEAMLEYDTGTPDDVLNMARAAIAKAKGAQ